MRKTKNEDLIREAIDVSDMLDFYTNDAQRILQLLKNTHITKTEEERWNVKNLIDDLELFTY